MAGRILETLRDRLIELGPDAEGAGEFEHWRLNRDAAGTAWLIFDKQGSSLNTLSSNVLEELSTALETLEANPPEDLVIRSAKAAGFCAGADIGEFQEAKDAAAVRARIEKGKAVLNRLEGLRFPTVAVIHGHCLGGGFELALACDIRIAIGGASFAFPEVRLGLHPGLDGTVRLTHLIDPTEAMRMMLTGNFVLAAKAKELRIVDAVTEERHVRNAVKAAISGEIEGAKQGLKGAALNTGLAREIAAPRMHSEINGRARPEHYPAPFALVDLWREHGGDKKAMQEAETQSFADLMFGTTAQNLIRAYFLREKLKKLSRGHHLFSHIHVIGAGTMGGDIAGWCAIQGLHVTLSDINNGTIGEAIQRTAQMAKEKHLRSTEIREALDRLIPDPDNYGVEKADLIIEAGPEKADIKKRIYSAIEPRRKNGAILATNTSSIPLDALGPSLADSSRFVGIHFFNPVARMGLVEIVSHDQSSAGSIDVACAFVDRIDKLPPPVRSAPGFLVNRSLMPYLLEAIIMLDEGIKAETIDDAAKRFGMPIGPLELADQVGLDTCLGVADVLRDTLDTPFPDLPDMVRKKVENGDLGRKTGRGFYDWEAGKAKKDNDFPNPDGGMDDRLILPMLNSCATCLRTGVVEDEETLDAAMIFATGFAPFRGGPLHYARDRGLETVAVTLDKLAKNHGERFEPDSFWRGRSGGL